MEVKNGLVPVLILPIHPKVIKSIATSPRKVQHQGRATFIPTHVSHHVCAGCQSLDQGSVKRDLKKLPKAETQKILDQIEEEISVLRVGHRSDVYKKGV